MSHTPKVVVFLGISLDGFIAAEGGDLSWLSACANESTAETGYDQLMDQTDALLLGRNTYDAVRQFSSWPYGAKPVYVLTHRPIRPAHGERAMQGNIEQALRAVHASGAKTVYLDGGDVVRQALQRNLVEELVLSWVPVVLGSGIRLFAKGLSPSSWHLVHSRSFQSGMVQASYRRAAPQSCIN
jgi:dihydrofolate reductase